MALKAFRRQFAPGFREYHFDPKRISEELAVWGTGVGLFFVEKALNLV